MDISHDFIATKTCLHGYEFLVVFGQKAYWTGAGWDCLRGGCGLEVCGAGTDKNFNPRRILPHTHDHVISRLDLLGLTSSERKRTENTGDHITSSQNKSHYLRKFDKNYPLW